MNVLKHRLKVNGLRQSPWRTPRPTVIIIIIIIISVCKNEKGLDSLIQTVHVFRSDIGMQFGIDKCATIVIKGGKHLTLSCYPMKTESSQ